MQMIGTVQSQLFLSIPQGILTKNPLSKKKKKKKKISPPGQIQGLAILMAETQELGAYSVPYAQQREFHDIDDIQLSAFVDVNTGFF